MIRLFPKWYECEQGHITAGDGKQSKCGAKLWELEYVKGKKGKWTTQEKKLDKPCGAPIIAEGDIPEKIDYSTIWDYKTCHAFLIGQKLDAAFVIGLQIEFAKLWKEITQLKKGKD